jgi:hypothetical protein
MLHKKSAKFTHSGKKGFFGIFKAIPDAYPPIIVEITPHAEDNLC